MYFLLNDQNVTMSGVYGEVSANVRHSLVVASRINIISWSLFWKLLMKKRAGGINKDITQWRAEVPKKMRLYHRGTFTDIKNNQKMKIITYLKK